MGTLPCSTFVNLNFRFRLLPATGGSGGRSSVSVRRASTNLCFLCKQTPEVWRTRSWFNALKCFSIGGGDSEEEKSPRSSKTSTEEVERGVGNDDLNSEQTPASVSSTRPPGIPSDGPIYSSFQVDSIRLMELLGPEKVDPSDMKLIKDKLFGYSTFWVTREEPFGDLGEDILFLGNLWGKREEVFARLQRQLHEVTGDKYNLFMVEQPNSEDSDPHGGPCVSFGLLRKEVSEPGPTTLWQYVIALLLFVLTIGSYVELAIASQR